MRPFVKMQALGNDFVVFDARRETWVPTAAEVRRVADRRLGVGCDQLIVIASSNLADAALKFWNADGGEVGACGNGTRAAATLLPLARTLETAGGVLAVRADDAGVTVDMGRPAFAWDAIPLAYPMDTLRMPVAWEALSEPVAVNVGNPHLVFVTKQADVDLARLGPAIEHDPLFPERINVGVAVVHGRDRIALTVWERGAGLTGACGTGAVAAAAALQARGLVDDRVTVAQAGGALTILRRDDGHILMTGPAAIVFTGEIEL